MSPLSPEWRAAVAQDRARPGESTWLGRLRCRDHGHTGAAGIVEHVTGADGRDDFAKLDPAESPDARNQLELLDRLFPRKTKVGAPNQRQQLRRIVPRVGAGARPNPGMMAGFSRCTRLSRKEKPWLVESLFPSQPLLWAFRALLPMP